MQEAERSRQHVIHDGEGRSLFFSVGAKDVGLRRLDKPIAIVAPKEIVQLLRHEAKLVSFVRCLDAIDRLIELPEDFTREIGRAHV